MKRYLIFIYALIIKELIMRKIILKTTILLLFIIAISNLANGQVKAKAEIKNVDFEIKNSKFIAIYDIVNFDPAQKYFVTIEILKNDGEIVEASTLTGDVNKFVAGGLNKKIEWDLLKDKIMLEDSIQVKIVAKTEANVQKEKSKQ